MAFRELVDSERDLKMAFRELFDSERDLKVRFCVSEHFVL